MIRRTKPSRRQTHRIARKSAICQHCADSNRQAEILDLAPDSITVHNLDGAVIYANQRALDMHGYSREEYSRLSLADLVAPDAVPLIAERLRRIRELGEASFEVDHLRRDGSCLPLAVRARIVRWSEQTALVSIGTDITTRRRIESTLCESERALANERALLAKLIDTIPDFVFYKDHAGTYLGCNPAFEEFVGRPRAEIIGRTDHDLFPPAVAEGFRECDRRMLDSGCSQRNDEWVTYPDGRAALLETLKTPYAGVEGAPLGVLGVSRDITQRRLAEERANVLAVQAARASAAKSEFLANMSHEIRTPMTAILGFGEAIRDRCPARCEFGHGEMREFLDIITGNGSYLLQLLNDILDLSKIEADKLEIERATCSPRRLLDEIATLIRPRCKAKGLDLCIEYVGEIPSHVVTDPTRLRQILINLLGNAIKFTDAGRITLTARTGALAGGQPALEIDVADTGRGMSTAEAAKLFQPFTQADASTTRRFGGTGLGLVISKRLGEALGGDVRLVETSPGVGSRFRVAVATGAVRDTSVIEARSTAEAVPAATGDDATEPLGCRILLAEDNPVNQRLISLVLSRAGAEVETVGDGLLAVDAALAARAAGRAFDVVLMDMQMPVMDGYTAVAMLRRQGYAGPLIALTAHAMTADRQRCLDAGCDDYATKPIDRAKLIATIRRHLDAERMPREADSPELVSGGRW